MNKGKPRKADYFTRGEVLDVIRLSPRQLQYWDETKLVRPRIKTKRRRYYDFANVVELRLIDALRREGFTTQKIRAFVMTLRRMMPRGDDVLTRLQILTDGRMLIFREKGAYFEMNGQGLLKLDLERLYHQVRPNAKTGLSGPAAVSPKKGTRERGERDRKLRAG